MASIKLKGDTSGEVTISAPSVAGTTTLELPATSSTLATQNSLGVRNLIINGDMRIAQRGTSATGITGTGYYAVDRYKLSLVSQGTWTVSQDTDVPLGQGFANSLKINCTTADASPASGDIIFFQQVMEGQNLQMLKKGTSDAESLTVSFWVKSAKTGTYVCEVNDTDNDRAISQSYTISSANTWEKKVLSFAGDTTGTLTNDNNSSLRVNWFLGAGNDFTSGTLATSWSSRTLTNIAVGQVNLADSTSNYINITGVQLEVGTEATPFEHRPYDMELARCQRYFSRLGSGAWGLIYSGLNADVGVQFPITMRSTPSVSHLANYQITLIATAEYTVTNTIINPSVSNSVNGIFVRLTSTGMSSGNCCISTANNIGFSAEL